MKTTIIFIALALYTSLLYSQCNPKVKADIPDGYSVLNELAISMEKPSDTLQSVTFVLNKSNEYKLLFVEEENYRNIASYQLYEDVYLLGSNYAKATNKFYPSFDFKCQKTTTYNLQVRKTVDKKYCGHCLLLVKGQDAIEVSHVELSDSKRDDIFVVVENMPVFKDDKGIDAFLAWIANNLVYPEEAKKNGIEGRVFIQFFVNTKGEVEDIKVIRAVDPLLDAEAVRVVRMSPIWNKPGYQSGQAVNVQFTIPVVFKN